MSKNLINKFSPFIKLKMFNEEEKTLGIVKDKVQVVITLPNINDFSKELKDTIKQYSKDTDCFIITASKKELINETIKEYELSKSLISLDFKNFATSFNLNSEENNLQKSLMIIDKNCKIAYRDVL